MFLRKFRLVLYGLIFLSFCSGMSAKVNLDSVDFKQSTIYQINDFDGDSYQDTLIGMRYKGMIYPYYITWHNNNAITKKTFFKLPQYENYLLKMNCLNLNQDNMMDLLFSITRFRKDERNRLVQDTAYHTVIFAQSKLKNLDSIDLTPVVGLVYSPIIQMDYQLLVQSKIRSDYSNGFSFNITKCNTEQLNKQNESSNNNSIVLNLFPNPVSNTLNINIKNIDDSHYSYQIMNSLGELMISSDGIKSKNTYSESVTLDNFASGLYLFTLYDNQQVIAIKTFMVSK